jgi:predicted fused transcriptional regulator/phosphomethylpyrimidine kinase
MEFAAKILHTNSATNVASTSSAPTSVPTISSNISDSISTNRDRGNDVASISYGVPTINYTNCTFNFKQ